MLGGCGGHSPPRTAPPAGFDPVSFTAIGERDYWVLGTYPCGRSSCFTILRTTDGGRSFTRVHAPALPGSGLVPTLRFADRLDGFAFVQGVGGVLYATHDGGATWRRLPVGTLIGFGTGAGNVYLVTGRCGLQGCTRYAFERAPVSGGSWVSHALPFTPDGPLVDLAAHGTDVWLLGTPAGGNPRSDTIARSSDGGRSFTTRAGPCVPGLGGDLEPASSSVVWAVCPTGMMAGAWRSTDGGVSFSPLKTPGLVNAARLAPASATTAVLAGNGVIRPLLRTTDGGATWTAAATPAKATYMPFAGFTDASVGVAIVQTGNARIRKLWRTTDGGATWRPVAFR